MAKREQQNFRPQFLRDRVPCEGDVGDILVMTKLDERDRDPEKQGSASVWFCVVSQTEEHDAIWRRVQFDGVASCDRQVPLPPQNLPELERG